MHTVTSKYDTEDTALGFDDKDYFQCKIDLRHGYCSVPIHQDEYKLSGSKWVFGVSDGPTYLLDTRLCFVASKPRKSSSVSPLLL